jgi:hypothetical protein
MAFRFLLEDSRAAAFPACMASLAIFFTCDKQMKRNETKMKPK